ncbi:hypothetical protein [uncultured Slackia sp.]|uniref:hypothetical protein n=1 Tax=uncultured Slackia sp. TaxID=665903 RepID=UPI0025EC907D|nr:hypothetical protein [uncultured Slackia sp.]
MGGGVTATPVDAAVSGGTASFELWGLGDEPDNSLLKALYNAALGTDGGEPGHEQTDATPIAYYAVVSDAPSVLPDPTAPVGIPASSLKQELEPGEYSVSANLVIKGEDNQVLKGVDVAMLSDEFPPTASNPAIDNATLTVSEDGDMVLHVELYNGPSDIITLQNIESGSNVEVLHVLRGTTAGHEGGYGIEGDNSWSADRILEVDFKLLDASGWYIPSNCRELNCINPPGTEISFKDMPIYLAIDFGNVKRNDGAEGEWSKSFTDEATGVSVTVKTNSEEFASELEAAALHVEKNADEDAYNSAGELLGSNVYTDKPAFEMWNLSLRDAQGFDVSLDQMATAAITLPTSYGVSDVYSYDGSSANSLDVSLSEGGVIFNAAALGAFLLVDGYSADRWQHFEIEDMNGTGSRYVLDVSDANDSMSTSMISSNRFSVRAEEADQGQKLFVDFSSSNSSFMWFAEGCRAVMELTVPENATKVLFVVDDGDELTAHKIDAVIENGKATFDFFAEEIRESTSEVNAVFAELYKGYWDKDPSYVSSSWPSPLPSAYFLVQTSESSQIAFDPTPVFAEYNGAEQTGITIDDNCEVMAASGEGVVVDGSEVKATNAGEYTVTVKPRDGFTWADGTTVEKTVEWSIEKATLEATYLKGVPYTWGEGMTDPTASLPSLEDVSSEIVVKGFVNGETPETAEDYSAPTATKWRLDSSFPKAGSKATVNISTPEAKNYKFERTSATGYFYVGHAPEDAPHALDGLVYNGEKQYCVSIPSSSFSFDEEAAQQTDAGTYTISASVRNKDNAYAFAMPDGTFASAMTITFTIEKAPLTAQYSGETVTKSSAPTYPVEVTGFVNGETAETAKGYVAPTIEPLDYVESGKYYGCVPQGGSADNYKFTLWLPGLMYVESAPPAKPKPIDGLVYNGEEQIGVLPGEGYTLTGNSATDPGDYVATAVLADGYVWLDGSTDSAVIPWKIEKADEMPEGTYRVSANVFIAGEDNRYIPGLTAYMTNPNHPDSLEDIGDASAEEILPINPVTDNALLYIQEDGTYIVVVELKNPVFTCQQINSGDDVKVLAVERDGIVYGGSDARYSGRITKLWLEVADDDGSYTFSNCREFPTLLQQTWDADLHLTVDFENMEKTSHSSNVNIPDYDADANDASKNVASDPDPSDPSNPGGNQGGSGGQGSGSGSGNQGGITGGNGTQVGPGTAGTVDSGTLKAGTYTVSANIWFDKADTGLPLNPHITSSVFPPMNPVSNNATLTVDSSGRARVSVPITIQDKVMSVKSISGLNIVSSSSSGGKLTSITVDLGVIDAATSVITESCSVGIHIGDIAATIMPESVLQGTREHTWPATFQVNFSGVPASGGGTVPASVQALLNGSTDGSTLESATADEAAADAQAAGEAAAALASRNANAGSGSGVGAAVRSLEDAMEHNPWLGFALGAGTVLVLGAIGVGLYAWRRRVAQAAADGSAAQTPTV